MICSGCQNHITSVRIENIKTTNQAGVGIGRATAYLCPQCSVVISVEKVSN